MVRLIQKSGYIKVGRTFVLISAVLDANAYKFTDRDSYMKYIALQPRVERYDVHGLL